MEFIVGLLCALVVLGVLGVKLTKRDAKIVSLECEIKSVKRYSETEERMLKSKIGNLQMHLESTEKQLLAVTKAYVSKSVPAPSELGVSDEIEYLKRLIDTNEARKNASDSTLVEWMQKKDGK